MTEFSTKSRNTIEMIVSKHIPIFGSRLEWWSWWFPTGAYDPKSNGRIHIIGKLYWRVG
jgi:hypothetical protein